MNYEAYYDELDRAMYDKLWWLDKVEDSVDTILDFGCSNAAMYGAIKEIMPGRFRYIGIDSDPRKLADAAASYPEAAFFTSTDEAEGSFDPDRTVLVLSSVIHELYAYLSVEKAESLLKGLGETGCRHICIRDMELLIRADKKKTGEMLLSAAENALPRELALWKDLRGDLSARGLLEMFLSYVHTSNIEREMKESYFGMDSARLKEIFSENYSAIYEEHFQIPYMIRKWRKEIFLPSGISLSADEVRSIADTHTKILFDRK